MSNIKLKDHYWETEGIYDTAQTATQKAINGEVVESARNIIKVQDTQPTSSYNKIWLPETVGDGTQVPTWAEHQALDDALNDATANFKWVGEFDNSIDIKMQVDDLGVGFFAGKIGSPSTAYFPSTTSGIVYVFCYTGGHKRIFYMPNGSLDETWVLWKSSTWRDWVEIPTRSEYQALDAVVDKVEGLLGRKNMANIETEDGNVPDGYFQFYWNRTGTPFSATNYSPLLFFRPSSAESTIMMLERGTGNLITRSKVDGVWNNWQCHDTRSSITLNVETDASKASRSYVKGEYVYMMGNLYVTRDTIAKDSALNNTNLLSTRITEHLSDLENAEEQSFGGTHFRAIRKSNICFLSCAIGYFTTDENHDHRLRWASSASGTYADILLTESIRPKYNVEAVDGAGGRRVTIGTDGYLYTNTNLSSATVLRFTTSWIRT